MVVASITLVVNIDGNDGFIYNEQPFFNERTGLQDSCDEVVMHEVLWFVFRPCWLAHVFVLLSLAATGKVMPNLTSIVLAPSCIKNYCCPVKLY